MLEAADGALAMCNMAKVRLKGVRAELVFLTRLSGRVLNPGKMVPVGCATGGLNTGTSKAILPSPASKPQNSVFSCMALLSPELSSLCWSPG